MTASIDLPSALRAGFHTLDTRVGRVGYYSRFEGKGIPVLLIHSVHAAASSKEMEPLFQSFRGARPVVAMDLPGFGRSGRDDIGYTPERMAEAITDVIRETAPSGVDIVALSLGAEFAARVALEMPEVVRHMALISPTGMGERRKMPGRTKNSLASKLLSVPAVGKAFFRVLRSAPSIRHYLQKSFTGKLDENLVDYALKTTAVAGAEHAPLAFLSGELFTADAFNTLYTNLTCPTLVLYDEDPYVDFALLEAFIEGHHKRQAQRIVGTRGLPHFERRTIAANTIRNFFGDQIVATSVAKARAEERTLTTPSLQRA